LWITNTGNVGIGTNNPGSLLTVGATSAASDFNGTGNQKRAVIAYASANTLVPSDDGFVIRNENTITGNTTGIHFSTGSGASSGSAQNVITASIVAVNGVRTAGQYSAGDLLFLTSPGGNVAALEHMRITSAGNVGIGTAAPIARLDILSPGNYTAPAFAMRQSNASAFGVYMGIDNAINGDLVISMLNSSTQTPIMMLDRNTLGVAIGQTYATPTSGVAPPSNGLIVQGNVGIGTTAPQSKLQVSGGEVQTASSGASCTASNAGAVRYASHRLTGC
jgi:hypothetical protein